MVKIAHSFTLLATLVTASAVLAHPLDGKAVFNRQSNETSASAPVPSDPAVPSDSQSFAVPTGSVDPSFSIPVPSGTVDPSFSFPDPSGTDISFPVPSGTDGPRFPFPLSDPPSGTGAPLFSLLDPSGTDSATFVIPSDPPIDRSASVPVLDPSASGFPNIDPSASFSFLAPSSDPSGLPPLSSVDPSAIPSASASA